MVIRSQNNKVIVNWNNVQGFQLISETAITLNDGDFVNDYTRKFCRIIAIDKDINLRFAYYDSDEKGEKVLNDLCNSIQNNESYYQFPQNDEI